MIITEINLKIYNYKKMPKICYKKSPDFSGL